MTERFHIRVSLARQELELFGPDGERLARYPVSTAARGAGEGSGSYQTPRGRHLNRAKIGAGQPAGAVFVGRRPTGDVWSPAMGAANPERDWILSRILWLSGCEPGHNRLGQCDSMRRYIYIHGTADEHLLGQPASHGCIRMANADVIDLFERVPAYTPVEIVDDQGDCLAPVHRPAVP